MDDLRKLEATLHDFFQTHRTERERNALASSALDSIEAGTAPEEASFDPRVNHTIARNAEL